MKVLVCDKIAPEGVQKLEEVAEVRVATGLSEAELIEAAADADAIVVRSATRITAPVIQAARQLKVIGRAGVGVDNIDVDAASARGVMVVNSPEGNIIAAAEHTIALTMAAARRIPLAHGQMTQRKWAKNECMGTDLRGKTFGIIGLGRIGSEVARRAQGLDMEVIAHDPGLSTDRMRSLGVEPVGFDELLSRSDFVSLHVPGGAATENLINAEALAKMKQTAYLINCSRGEVIDDDALVAALGEGRLAGAAIDVYRDEPKPWSSPLIDAENIVLTPHLGASTTEAQVVAAVDVAIQVAEVLRGNQPQNAVNVPTISPDTAQELRPWLPLAERTGALLAHLAQSGLRSVHVEYFGGLNDLDCRMVTRATLVGLLSRVGHESLNIISAPTIAAQRGVEVTESTSDARTPFHSVFRVTGEFDEGELTASGTLRGLDEPRVVRVGSYSVDFVPSDLMLLVWFTDKPGVIGRVGTILGETGVNIGQMHVGRPEVGGTALMVLNLDGPVPPEALRQIGDLETVRDMRMARL